MKATIHSGIPGSGKSTHFAQDDCAQPCRVLWAAARTQLIDEQAADCRAYAAAQGSRLVIEVIHSAQPGQKGRVGRRLETTLQTHQASKHIVVMVTHEALFGLDPRLLKGWHVVIDEVPDGCVASGCFTAQASWSMLEHHYKLEPVGDGRWWYVVPRADVEALKRGEITKDAAKDLASFHQCVLTPGRMVLVDLGDWQDARHLRRKVRWWSVWTPMSLADAASVTITGAGFFRSPAYHAARAFHADAITFEPADASAGVIRAQQTFRIHYYTQHRGSTEWWETEEGSRCLVQISRHLEQIGFAGYWSCNADIRAVFRHRFGGVMCDPRQAGTNSLRHQTACAFFYSNKAQEADSAILEVLGLDRDAVMQAREYEDIVQFVMRGAPRDPRFRGTYEVHLYSRDQAEMLERYLVENGIAAEVTLVPVHEAGVMDVVRPALKGASGTEIDPLSHEERSARRRKADAARQQLKRDKEAAQRKAEGTYRRAGRPRKTLDERPPALQRGAEPPA